MTGALYLERLPIITPPLSKLEQEYREYKLQQETEQSLLSDFEISKKEEEWAILIFEQLHELNMLW